MLNAQFANLWHGKLRPGAIELVADTPVTTITIGEVTKSVQTIDGNLGVTRYCKAPGLPVPVTPDDVAALHGELKNDFILYSDKFRYSPLSPQNMLVSPQQWMLFDGTAQRWRRMSASILQRPLSNSSTYPSPVGTPSIEIIVDRGPVFGNVDYLQGDPTPAPGSSSYVGSQTMPLTYAYSPLHRPTSSTYKPDNRDWSIEPSPDGRKILVRLEAERWSGFEIPPEASGLPGTIYVYDVAKKWIFNVWEITFSADGSTMAAATEVWPDRPIATFVPWVEVQMTQNGSVYWTETVVVGDPTKKTVYYYLPLKVETRSNAIAQYDTSIMINAAYDKDGVIQLTHFRMYSENVRTSMISYHGVLITTGSGLVMPVTDDPAAHVPTYWFDNAWHRYEPSSPGIDYTPLLYGQYGQGSNGVLPKNGELDDVITNSYVCKIEVAKGTTVLKSWSAPFSGPLSWSWKTNNVVELYTGTTSLLRVGPGVVDDTPISVSGYAAWNPRTGQLLSSVTPIGFV